MEPHGADAVGHPGPFRGFPINTAHWITKEKRLDVRLKLESSHSRQHDLHHHVSVGDSSTVLRK